MKWRRLDFDPVTGVMQRIAHDSSTGETVIHNVPIDPTPQLEACQALRNDDGHWKKGVKKDLVHYAHIDSETLLRWLKMGVNINDTKELFRMVNREKKQKLTRFNHA